MVSSVSSLSSASTASTTTVSAATLAKLKALGLTSTGSEALDKANITKAEAEKSQTSSSTASSEHKSQGTHKSPYASILSELGLTQTGTKDGDETAINNAISKLTSEAKTDVEKAKAASIQAEWTNVQSQAQQKSASVPFEAAQSQASAVNKQLLVS